MNQAFREIIRLSYAMAAAGVLLAGPAYLVAGSAAVSGLVIALLVCWLPGVAALGLQSSVYMRQSPLAGFFLGMGLRMAFVLAAVLVSRQLWPQLSAACFVAWLVPAYLVALTVETRLVLPRASVHHRDSVELGRIHATPSP